MLNAEALRAQRRVDEVKVLWDWLASRHDPSTARPDAQKPRERKDRAAPVGMTDLAGARQA